MFGQRQKLVCPLALLVIAIIVKATCAGPPMEIVGGDKAAPGEFPYIVSIQKNGEHFCGGSIVSKRWVLTACHCVHGHILPYSTITVRTGTTTCTRGGRTYQVVQAITHGDFNTNVGISGDDIALLKLRSDIKFDAYTSAIGLPRAVTPAYTKAVVSGWGFLSGSSRVASTDLNRADMTIVDLGLCQAWMDSTIYREQICAFNRRGIGTCYGDSGGPLVAGNELIGVTSYNKPCALGRPDVYTAVYYYVPWIKKNIQ